MKVRLNKLVNYAGKEYGHLIGSKANQYCDMCALKDECGKVLSKEIPYENSSMAICARVCEEENTHFAFFVESKDVKRWCDNET